MNLKEFFVFSCFKISLFDIYVKNCFVESLFLFVLKMFLYYVKINIFYNKKILNLYIKINCDRMNVRYFVIFFKKWYKYMYIFFRIGFVL